MKLIQLDEFIIEQFRLYIYLTQQCLSPVQTQKKQVAAVTTRN